MVHGALELQTFHPQIHITVLRAIGRIDAETAPRFLDACRAALDSGHLVANLAGVTFLSSSGVGALLVLLESARELCRELSVAPASPEVTSALESLNLGQTLQILDSEAEALARLRAA